MSRFLDLVISRQPDIQTNRLSLGISSQNVLYSNGFFDPVFSVQSTRAHQISSATPGAFIDGGNTQFGLSKLFDFGGTLVFNARTDQTDSPLIYDSTIGLQFSLPLLKGFGLNVGGYSLHQAQFDLEKARALFISDTNHTLLSAVVLYGQYFIAYQLIDIYQKKLDVNRYLLDVNQRKEALHLADHIDVLVAELAYQNSVTELESATHDFNKLGADLALFIGIEQIPTDFISLEAFHISYQSDLSDSGNILSDNPDIRAAMLAVTQSEDSLSYAQNQLAPDIRFVSGLGSSRTDSNWAQSFQFQDLNYSVGVTWTYPLSNSQAAANYQKQSALLDQARIHLAQVQQSTKTEFIKARLDVQYSQSKIGNMQKSVEIACEKLTLQKKLFDLGLATTDKVIQAEEDLQNATLNYAQSQIDFVQAVFVLESLTSPLIYEDHTKGRLYE